jgi:HK97 family phage portal protein
MWPFKKKALTGTPAVLESLSDRTMQPFPLLGGGNRQRIQDAYNTAQSANYSWLYARSPALRKVVDLIVRNIGQLDLRLYEEISEDERQPRPNHPAALSLRYPSETVTQDKWIRSMLKDFLLYDNAYSLLVPATAGQIWIERMPAHMVEVRGSSLFTAEGYRLWRRDGTFTDLTPDQVLHWHGENPDDPRIGLSHLDTLRDVLAEDVALRQATVELANAGLTEPAWVYRPLEAPEWTNEARKGFEADLENRLRRRNKTPVVLEEGMEMKSFGVSPKDAEMMSLRKWAVAECATEYGVPLGMVGLADNVEEAREEFYADCLPPYCEDFTGTLNQRILVRAYNWTEGCFEFNLDEKLMGNERLKTLVSATGRAVMTTDEARAKLNLPPVDGGDELVTPMNVVVGDNPKPSPQINPPQDPNGPSQDGDARDGDLPESSRRAQLPAAKAEEFEPITQLVPARKRELDRQHENIDMAQAAVQRHFNRLSQLLRGKAAKRFDWGRSDEEFADQLNRVLKEIVRTEGQIYATKLVGEFDMRRVQNYLRAMAEGAAEGINSKVREEIAELGLDEALAKAPQHVASAGVGLGAHATWWAREETARQSPNPEGRVKTWIADTQRHAEFDGMTVPLGADWPAGFAPGTAPGCRCTASIS